MFSHLQRQGVDFHTEEKAGVLLTRMTSDIEALSVLFQEGIVNLLVQVFTLLVITGALFFYDPLLAAVTLAVAIPPTLASSLWFRSVSARNYLTSARPDRRFALQPPGVTCRHQGHRGPQPPVRQPGHAPRRCR